MRNMSYMLASLLAVIFVAYADDADFLQKLLDSGVGRVEFPDGAFVVSRPLIISSNTHLVCSPRTVVRLADGANCPVLRNRGSEPGGFDCNIIVEGGIWDGNNVHQKRGTYRLPGMPGGGDINQLTVFAGIKNLTLRGMTLKDPDCYCIELTDIDGFLVEDIVFDCNDKTLNQDGLHIDGWARNGYVRNLRGHTNDDMVALNSDEGSWRSPSNDITNVTIDGIYGGEDGYTAVRLLSRDAHVRDVVIRNVFLAAISTTGFRSRTSRSKSTSRAWATSTTSWSRICLRRAASGEQAGNTA